ncbi:MAG: 2-phosphosulfolactate phosphatase [Ilumatobacteraceae bacterium]
MARHLARWELDGVGGAVVVIDVIRAFTTAAYAFGAGATEIYLVDSVEDALAFKAAHPGSLAMGENRGLRPEGFDFPNSPGMVRAADLIERGRTGQALDAAETATALLATAEARKTLALGPDHCDPIDIELAATVDAFDFAMEAERTDRGLRLTAITR